MKNKSYNFFTHLANPTKFKIIMALKESPLSVTEIINTLKEEQSKISHNLKSLTQCHIVEVKKQGKKRIYELNKDTILPMIELVKLHARKYCLGKCHKD
ncbi:MAG: metalloregulator ArsR/SmtB family transcription factor [Nanoarchaeota archaeon]|nr:metalloregulator ArsR/SmtB family transcription factor [Nanoarchaeota archaeon]